MCDEHHIATLIHLFLHFCRNEDGIVVHGWQGAWTADVGAKTDAGKEQGADGDVMGFEGCGGWIEGGQEGKGAGNEEDCSK